MMDWSTFVPTLLATFAGVFLSVVLSLSVYRLRSRRSEKKRAKETRQTLLHELDVNKELLQEHVDGFRRLKGLKRELSLVVLSRLRTGAFDTASQDGRVCLLDDVALQRDLADLVDEWRFFNVLLQRYEDVAIHVGVQLDQQRAVKLLSGWDEVVMRQAEKLLEKTFEVRQKLEAAK